jgi:hypothetical protein
MQTNSELIGNQELQEKANQICNQYGLDFTIEKEPLKGSDTGRETKFFGLFNSVTGEALCTVKENYRVTQTHEVIQLVLTAIMDISTLRITKAGSLNGGRKIFIQLAVEGFSKVGDELIERYITVIDSNDKTQCLSVGIGDITMSCSNQFAYFYNKSEFKLQHASTIEAKLKKLPLLINAALKQSEAQIGTYERMNQIACGDNDIDLLVKACLGYDKVYTSVEDLSKKSKKSIEKMDTLYECINHEIECKGRTLYGLLNGVTLYTTHHLKAVKRDNGVIESLLVGTAQTINQKAFEWCLSKFPKES